MHVVDWEWEASMISLPHEHLRTYMVLGTSEENSEA